MTCARRERIIARAAVQRKTQVALLWDMLHVDMDVGLTVERHEDQASGRALFVCWPHQLAVAIDVTDATQSPDLAPFAAYSVLHVTTNEIANDLDSVIRRITDSIRDSRAA